MIFNSTPFVVFFLISFTFYWVLNKNLKVQNVFLFIISYFFYGWWDYRFLLLIFTTSFIGFIVALMIEREAREEKRKLYLYISICCNLGLLAFFKYFNFFAESFTIAANGLGWHVDAFTLNIILPAGISFFTFETMSYTIDVYRREMKPTKNLISFLTFVSFFPKLVAGPIERASNLMPQIENKRSFDHTLFLQGIFQITVGFFRKMVIADNLSIYVDNVYGNPGIHNSMTVLLATVFYAFQIYFDFAGYSDIAIGVGKLFGLKFNRNFDVPYFSKSITEFWRRWHISLSSWLRDYLYISLGGSRKSIKITYRNLFITMFLGGLWHGSSWNFVIWGSAHGVLLCIEKFVFKKFNTKDLGYFGYIYTFSFVVLAWIFFRATSFHDALTIVSKIFSANYAAPFIGDINVMANSLIVLAFGVLIDIFLVKKKIHLEEVGSKIKTPWLITILTFLIMFIILFYSTSNNFIYFQF